MRYQPRLRYQLLAIWVLAAVAEIVVLARLVTRLQLVAMDTAAPLSALAILWNLVALIGIPAAALLIHRQLRRDRARGDQDRDRSV